MTGIIHIGSVVGARRRTFAALAAGAAVLGTVLVTTLQPTAAAGTPTMTAPGRIYPTVDAVYPFAGTDGISGDAAVLSVSGMDDTGCDPNSGNGYDTTSCPRVQMDLNASTGGLLFMANLTGVNLDADPEYEIFTHNDGAVINQITDPLGGPSQVIHLNGTQAQLNNALQDLEFQPAAGYEERQTDDGLLPRLTSVAVQGGVSPGATDTKYTYIKTEGTNDGPTLSAPATAVDAAAGASTDLNDEVSVVDPEMCNFTICGNPYTDPGLVEGDDEMLLVAWLAESSCGDFNLRGGVFTTLGGPALANVHTLLTDVSGADLEADQAAAIEASISPTALALDLSAQAGGPLSDNTVFAAIGQLDEVRYALSTITFNAPADDAVCNLNITVSDLGNNGAPLSYVGSQIGGSESPQPGYEVPDAKGDTTSVTFNVKDSHPGVTIDQALPTLPGVAAGPNSPGAFTVTFDDAIEPGSFDTGDLSLSTSSASGPALGVLVPVTPGLVYTVPVTATGDGTLTLEFTGTVCAAGHGTSSCDSGFDNDPPTYDDNEIDWDQTGPDVAIAIAPGQGNPTSTSPIQFEVTIGESLTTAPVQLTSADIDITGTAGGTLVANVTQPDPLDLTTFLVSISGMTTGGTVSAEVKANAIVDLALNGNAASGTATVTWQDVDTTDPTVTIDLHSGQADPTNASPIVFDAVFSEQVTGFVDSDIVLGGTAGATTAVVAGGPQNYTITVTGMSQTGTVTVTFAAGAAEDGATNPSEAPILAQNSVEYDIDAPTVTIEQGGSQADPTSVSPIVFDVVFSEPVTGFTNADVTLGGTAGATTAVVAGGPTSYTVQVSGMTQTGTVTASLAAGIAQDGATNANLASSSGDATVQYNQPLVDNTPPMVTIDQGGSQADPTSVSPIVFDVVFSEPVTGFATGDVTLGGTAGATTAVVSGGPTTFTVQVSGMTQPGTVTASLAAGVAQDLATNASLASTSTDNSVQYNQPAGDVTPPTVTINQGASQADPTGSPSIVFDVVFSEAVSGFATGDVTLGGTAGATTAVVSGGPTSYTVTVSGMTQTGTVTASIGAIVCVDLANNPNQASTSTDNTVTFNLPAGDVTPPSVAIDQAPAQADPTSVSPVVFVAVFSEPVAGFGDGDVILGGTAGATTAVVSGGPSSYTVTVSGMTQSGTVIASIGAGAATDAALNPSLASTSTDNTVAFVFSIAISTPGGQVSISATGGELISFTTASPSPALPPGFTAPYGMLNFSASTTPGGYVTFVLTLPAPVVDYLKLVGSTWASFTWDGSTGFQINGNTVSVTIQDNGRGDADPTVGVVADPGMPVLRSGTIPVTGSGSEVPLRLATLVLLLGASLWLATRPRRVAPR